jgi:uncharacterized OB-fold protein
MTARPTPPVIDEQNAPYWSALGQGRLELQRCVDCGYVRYPPRWICPECLSERAEWIAMKGAGSVHSFIWYYRPFDDRFQDVPYNVAVVELQEGPRLISNVINVKVGELAVGQSVQARIVNDDSSGPLLLFEKEAS